MPQIHCLDAEFKVSVTLRFLNGVSEHDCGREDQHGQQQAESSGRTGHGGGREHCDDPVHGGHDVDGMGHFRWIAISIAIAGLSFVAMCICGAAVGFQGREARTAVAAEAASSLPLRNSVVIVIFI